MAEFSKLIITDQGKNLLMKVIENEISISFTKMVTSSQIYSMEELKLLTALGNVKQENDISEIEKENPDTINVHVILPNIDLVEGYFVRTIGLYANDPDDGEILYGVSIETSRDGCYVPPYNNRTVSNIYFNISVTVGNSENVTLNVNQGAVVTVKQLNKILYPQYKATEELLELESGEILFDLLGKIQKAVSALIAHLSDIGNPHKVTKQQIGLGNVPNVSTNDQTPTYTETSTLTALVSGEKLSVALGKIAKAVSSLISHIGNKSNPHGVTKSQIGLGEVDNTSDVNKPVSAAQQTALDAYYEQSTGYVNNQIAQLINGAPSTLDTLGEIAKAMKDNADVVAALDEAIGKKANEAEFDTHIKDTTAHITSTERDNWNNKMEQTGDSANNTVTFTSADASAPTSWSDVPLLSTGEKHSSVLAKIAMMFKNMRYLYKVLGTTDISAIGDGTVSGAVKLLNSNLSVKFCGGTDVSAILETQWQSMAAKSQQPIWGSSPSIKNMIGVIYRYDNTGFAFVAYQNETTTLAIKRNTDGTWTGEELAKQAQIMDMYRTQDCKHGSGLSFTASGTNGVTISAPAIDGFTPIMATLVSTNHTGVYCVEIVQQANRHDFLCGFRNTSTVGVSGVVPVIRVLYIRTSMT